MALAKQQIYICAVIDKMIRMLGKMHVVFSEDIWVLFVHSYTSCEILQEIINCSSTWFQKVLIETVCRDLIIQNFTPKASLIPIHQVAIMLQLQVDKSQCNIHHKGALKTAIMTFYIYIFIFYIVKKKKIPKISSIFYQV